MGDLVVVTGASAGLGVGFAKAFAARGHDLLLVARRRERLEALASELRDRHGVAVEVCEADLEREDGVARVVERIGGRAVDALVNNAGFGSRGAFAELPIERQAGMIALNCTALVRLSHAVLPGMRARGRGGILNVASTAAFQPGPWMAVYYATKAFVLSLSEALHEEVKGDGVHVAALCPGPTRTEFAEAADMGDSELFKRFAGDADKVVQDGLTALDRNQAVKVSGTMNNALASSIRFTPRGMARRIAGALQKTRG